MVHTSALEAAIARPRVTTPAAMPQYLKDRSGPVTSTAVLPQPTVLPPPTATLGRPATTMWQTEEAAVDYASVAQEAAAASEVKESVSPPPPVSHSDVRHLQKLLQGKHLPTDVGMIIDSISSVDEVAGTFSIEFTVFQRWRGPASVQNDVDMKGLRKSYRPQFANGLSVPRDEETGAWPDEVVKELPPSLVADSRPTLAFPDALSCMPVDGSLQCYLSPNDEPGLVRCEQRFHGIFLCRYDLRHFPFDTQTLPLTLVLDKQRDAHRAFRQIAGPGGDALLELKDSATILPQGWRLHSVPTAAIGRDREGSGGRAQYTVAIQLARADGEHYVWTCAVPAATAAFLCLPAFMLPSSLLAGRMALLLVLLLGAAASRLLLAGGLASASSARGVTGMTLVDIHGLACFMLVQIAAFGVEGSAAIVHNSDMNEERVLWLVDLPIAFVLLLCTLGFHFWWVQRVLEARANAAAGELSRYAISEVDGGPHIIRGTAGYEQLDSHRKKQAGHVRGPF